MQGSNNYVVQLFLFIRSSLNYIFLSQSSRTCDDTNLSLYNFPSLLLSPSLDVIHKMCTFFLTLCILIFRLTLLFHSYIRWSFNVTVCAVVAMNAPIIQLRTSLGACTHTRPAPRAYAYQVCAGLRPVAGLRTDQIMYTAALGNPARPGSQDTHQISSYPY